MPRAADDQPLRLVARIAPRIRDTPRTARPAWRRLRRSWRRHRPPPWLKPDHAAISASASRGCRSRPMSAPCCAPRTPSAPRSASSSGAGFDARAGRLADTADTPEHVPLWRFPDVEALDAAAALRAGRRGTAGRRDRSALVPPSAERCLRARARSDPACRRPCCDAAATWCAFPPASRSIWRWPARWCCTTGCCSTAASPSARSAVAVRLHRSRCRTRHGPPRFRRNIPDWVARTRPSHDPSALVASDLAPYLSRHAPDRGLAHCSSLPCPPAHRRSRSRRSPQSRSRRRGVRRNSASSMTGSPRRIRSRARPSCYAFVRAKNSVPALPGRGEVVLTVTERPSRPRHGGDQRRLPIRARTRR